MQLDLRLQLRNGFYFAAGFASVVLVIVILWIGADNVFKWLPLILFGNAQFSSFYFMAALVLLERDEGTVYAQAVSPMTVYDYLWSKSITLSILVTLENVLLVLVADGSVSALLIVTLMLLAMCYCLLGLICVLPFQSINTFLLPSMLVTAVATLPVFHYLGIWGSVAYYLHPLSAHLYALDIALNAHTTKSVFYVLPAMLLALGVCYVGAVKAYDKFIFEAAG